MTEEQLQVIVELIEKISRFEAQQMRSGLPRHLNHSGNKSINISKNKLRELYGINKGKVG